MRWVHASARSRPETARRHASFILSHLSSGALALIVLPLWLAFSGPTTLLEASIFAWLIAPIALAFIVSRTGKIDIGIIGSLIATSGFISWFSILTGGLESIALFWFCILPLEAALFGGPRAIVAGLLAAIVGFLAVAIVALVPGLMASLPNADFNFPAYHLSVLAALVYGAVLAHRIEKRRLRHAAKIRARDGQFKLLSDHSTDLITRHTPDGETVFASPASARLLQSSPDSLRNKGLYDRIHIADRVAFLKALSDASARNCETNCEFRVARGEIAANGGKDYFWVEMRCRPVPSEGGSADVVAVTRDISTSKAHENEIMMARALAEASNEAKSKFLANVTHELRTPLNAIIGFSDLIRTDVAPERKNEHADLINDAGRHLLQLVNDLLDVSKIEAGKYELMLQPFQVDDCISSTLSMLDGQADAADVFLQYLPEDDQPEIEADYRATRQILINLISNAIKFTGAGGTISVSVKSTSQHLTISVADTGVGIAADDLARLGTPFTQGSNGHDRQHNGTGLGLSLVKGLTELHGGSFKLESKLGHGTKAHVTLPIRHTKPGIVPANTQSNLVVLGREQARDDSVANTRKPSQGTTHARKSA
ncbi:MAG: ATP-binding protein [Pseudomonadota bacterium]